MKAHLIVILDTHTQGIDQDRDEYALLEVLVVDELLGPSSHAPEATDAAASAGLEVPVERGTSPPRDQTILRSSPGVLVHLVLHVAAARANLPGVTGPIGKPLRTLLLLLLVLVRYVTLGYACENSVFYLTFLFTALLNSYF